MNEVSTKMIIVAKWIDKHEKSLKSLYRSFKKDKKHKKIMFKEFAEFIYSQCKHTHP